MYISLFFVVRYLLAHRMPPRNYVVTLYRDYYLNTYVWVRCAPYVIRTVRVLCASCHARAVHVLSPVFLLREAFTLSMTSLLTREKDKC